MVFFNFYVENEEQLMSVFFNAFHCPSEMCLRHLVPICHQGGSTKITEGPL